MGRVLSKSKLVAYRQCPKRLWLEVHRPDLREDSAQAQAKFKAGNQVGDIARQQYDPRNSGVLLDAQAEGFDAVFDRTKRLLDANQPIFEAAFRTPDALAFADVLLPVRKGGKRGWKMVEVKSATTVKDYHRDDAAIQVFIARATGVPLLEAAVACIDSSWVYQGDGDYAGLLAETDVTVEALSRGDEVKAWIADAHRVVAGKKEPDLKMGRHCNDPFECSFSAHCMSLCPAVAHPISLLPGALRKPLQAFVKEKGLTELGQVPDELLNDKQQRVKQVTLSGRPYFNRVGAAAALQPHKLPAYFMDFETIQFAVPIWKGTRPYQQIPFQFSVHRLSRTGLLAHESFLDLSGKDPSVGFAKALIEACGSQGPVFSYNAGFEVSRIRDLAARFPRLAKPLNALATRVVDLLPVARDHYYHPAQEGSWSIKAVLPALCPDLDYAKLEGVKDGGMAMEAFVEAVGPSTTKERKDEIERQLIAYCALDTLALVRLWSAFSGSKVAIR
ncbi:DUF2779 domain-containing protein [Thermomonas aquatica]|uniref:DUF2779 domain-containing protein n=1 Tax=Thermomonas aquatica TaxID=2202149 RepID=A0A5B7ZQF6_9GAMM|nr:DUF2779 domain-containing protein [Thermomonas aquatica]QDA56999.1 DUF2779 domain-containing protein [Thermomonas aquatica]